MILMATLGIVLGSCAKDKTEPAGTDNILPADGVVSVFPTADGLQTRAEGMNTAELQKQGFYLFVQNKENGNYDYTNSIKWTYSPDDGWTSAQPMLWERADREVTVTAYAGMDAVMGISEKTDIALSTDQSAPDGSAITKWDLLYASSPVKPSAPVTANDIYYDTAKKGLVIRMKHRLTKLKIEVRLATTFNAPDKGNATARNPLENVAVNGTRGETFTWKMEDDNIEIKGLVTPVTPFMNLYTPGEETSPSASGARGGTACYECILFPQTVPEKAGKANLSVSFRINEKTYTWTSTAPVTFERSKEYILPLTVEGRFVSVGDVQVKDWEDAPIIIDDTDYN